MAKVIGHIRLKELNGEMISVENLIALEEAQWKAEEQEKAIARAARKDRAEKPLTSYLLSYANSAIKKAFYA